MRSELRISLVYFMLATLWIIFSDAVVAAVTVPELMNAAQTYKGALFVVVTSLLLFAMLSHEFGQRRRSERALRREEAKSQYLFLSSPLPMWVYDLDTLAFLDVNEAAVVQYGYSREEFLSMRLTDIRPPDEVQRLLDDVAQQRPALQVSGQWRHRLKNGQIIDVEIRSHKLDYNGQQAAIVVALDVTEKVRARQELQRSSEALEAVIGASPLAIYVLDRQGRIMMCNPAAERIFGWNRDELVGHVPPFIPSDRVDEFFQLLDRVRQGEAVTNFETRRLRRDGALIEVSISTAPLHNGQEIHQVMSIVADITERKRMEADLLEQEKLRMALNKEIELRRLRTRFMSMISHEFRNPLAIIATSSSIVERYHDRMSVEARVDHFNTIQAQIKRLTEMLDDILTILRSESIGPDFKTEPVDLVLLCRELVQEKRLNLEPAHQIELASQVETAVIAADKKLLRQAIDNLLSNALKYSPPESPVQVELRRTDDEISLRVKDVGIGIPPEDIKRLVEPFYRASNVGDIPGTGLGLAITRQALELHGGRMEVESAVGAGSVFTLYLPVSAAL